LKVGLPSRRRSLRPAAAVVHLAREYNFTLLGYVLSNVYSGGERLTDEQA